MEIIMLILLVVIYIVATMVFLLYARPYSEVACVIYIDGEEHFYETGRGNVEIYMPSYDEWVHMSVSWEVMSEKDWLKATKKPSLSFLLGDHEEYAYKVLNMASESLLFYNKMDGK